MLFLCKNNFKRTLVFETPPEKEELKNKLKLTLYQLGFIF